MKKIKRLKKIVTANLGYDALDKRSKARKGAVLVSSVPEDRQLTDYDRQELTSQVRDAERNFTLAGFALRKHLQYMSAFRFSAETGNTSLDDQVERLFYDWADDPERCHAARRHSFWTLLELIEKHRTCDGDVGIVRIADGSLQLIESDRIRSESSVQMTRENVHGVHLNEWGQITHYDVWKRPISGGAYEMEREISSQHMDLVGYFGRNEDVRGVTPFAPAITTLQQLYKGISYALAKMKIEQMFGLITNRIPELSGDSTFGRLSINEQTNAIREEFDGELFHLDLGNAQDEKAEFLKGETPSANFQNFTTTAIRLAFAALDIPYSFLDGSATNFYGSKGELNGYVNGCKFRQRGVIVWLNRLSKWLISRFVAEGRLTLPFGWTPLDVRFRWIGASTPFWRLIDDSKGYQVAIANGLTSPEQVAAEHGGNYFDNIDQIAYDLEYARKRGVITAWDPSILGKTNIGV